MRRVIQFLHEHRLAISPSNRSVGIVYTLVGWCFLAFITPLFRRTIPKYSLSENFFFQYSSIFLFMFLSILYFSFLWGIREWQFHHQSSFRLKRVFTKTFFSIFLRHIKNHLIPNDWKVVLLRGFFAVLAYYAYCVARVSSQIIDNSILFSTDPFFVALILLSVGIRLSGVTWIGILIGFLGISFIYSFDIRIHTLAGVVGLLSGFSFACVVILNSYAVSKDSILTIIFYQSVVGLVVSSLIGIKMGFSIPKVSDLSIMFSSGFFLSWASLLFLQSFHYTESHVLAALSYSLPFFVELFNWIMIGEIAPFRSMVGNVLIATSGLVIISDSYCRDKKRMHHYNVE
jgi:drug/metabolite transporter (DMT)-like permease